MHTRTNTPSRPGIAGAEAFTLTGVITGMAATAAAVVLGILVTARVAQHGVRDAEAAIAGIQSSIAGSLSGPGAEVPTGPEGPADPEPVAEPPDAVCYRVPQPPAPPMEVFEWNPPCVTPLRAWHCRFWRRRPRFPFPGRLLPPRRR